jgi:hypothetical protein
MHIIIKILFWRRKALLTALIKVKVKVKVKHSYYRPGEVLSVPGG